MKRALRKLLGITPEYRIVEVEKFTQRFPEETRDQQESVQTLAAHPGFVFLLAKLHHQRAALESQLKHSHHNDIRAVEFIQSGIFWSSWLENQLSKATTGIGPGPQPASPEEDRLYREAQALTELVGRSPSE